MGQGPLDVKRELDEVVPPFEPREGGPAVRRYARLLARALAAAVLALIVVAAIVFVLHKHLADAQTALPPRKPVPIHILPAPQQPPP